MDSILNAVKDSVMESVLGNKQNNNDENLRGGPRRDANMGTYSSTLDETANTYAESRAQIESKYSSDIHHDRDSSSMRGSGSYESFDQRSDDDNYRQQDHSYGSSDQRREHNRQDDDSYGSKRNPLGSDTYSYGSSSYGGHGGRSQEGNDFTYGGARGGQDSVRDTRDMYSRHEGVSRREGEDSMRHYEDEGRGYGGHGGRPGNARQGYDDRFESGKEYRPAQGSGGMMMGISGSGGYGEASRYAQQRLGSDGDDSMFSNAAGYISDREPELEREHLDEGDLIRSHRELYGNGGYGGERSSVSLGQAAAMQALKYFTTSNSGTGDQNAFIGMAMAEAANLFDSQSSKGNLSAQSTKQDVINQAAKIALKLFLKSKIDASGGGSGGADGLMKMASQFLLE